MSQANLLRTILHLKLFWLVIPYSYFSSSLLKRGYHTYTLHKIAFIFFHFNPELLEVIKK